jgi:hypothetical protein
LGQAEARRRIEQGFAAIEGKTAGGLPPGFKLEQSWSGDRLELEGGALGQTFRGRIDVLPDVVAIEVDLPEFLAVIGERIVSVLKRETQKLLE